MSTCACSHFFGHFVMQLVLATWSPWYFKVIGTESVKANSKGLDLEVVVDFDGRKELQDTGRDGYIVCVYTRIV